jgi:hypothetical protein
VSQCQQQTADVARQRAHLRHLLLLALLLLVLVR